MNNRMIPRAPEVCSEALVENIIESERVSAMTARALIRRGVSSAEEARRFLHPSELSLHDPYLLPDMERAVERIRLAIERSERICVYGDYDADGVCSTAMLTGRLQSMGAVVSTPFRSGTAKGTGFPSNPCANSKSGI
jgi:single-stranded-DNA-specific exonuclease